jgi:hypothetical protein
LIRARFSASSIVAAVQGFVRNCPTTRLTNLRERAADDGVSGQEDAEAGLAQLGRAAEEFDALHAGHPLVGG